MTKNKTPFRYIGGAAFAMLALDYLVFYIPRLFHNPWVVITIIRSVLPYALLAAGFFSKSKGLTIAGAVGLVIDSFLQIFNYIALQSLLLLAADVLLLIATASKKRTHLFAFASAATNILLRILFWHVYENSFSTILFCIVHVIGVVSVAFVPMGKKKIAALPKAAVSAPADITDDLLRLKALKDRGILTEEEFAEQKTKLLAKTK